MTWHLKSYTNCKHSHCEVCGKEITHNWFISDGTTTMRVGSECMGQYLTGTKKVFKHVSMAQSILRKHGMNNSNWGGDEFASFWIDYYVNVALLGIKTETHPRNVFYNFWQPYSGFDVSTW